MKLLKTALITATATAALTGAAMAQLVPSGGGNPATFNATATATILEPITIAETTAMAFGTIALANAGSPGTVTTGGVLTNAAVLLGTPQAGTFSINGSDLSTVDVIATAGACSQGGASLAVSTLPTALLDSAGHVVDGTLTIDSTVSGALSCAYSVSAAYQ